MCVYGHIIRSIHVHISQVSFDLTAGMFSTVDKYGHLALATLNFHDVSSACFDTLVISLLYK